jgi:probable F420-dependent oxidoreductase
MTDVAAELADGLLCHSFTSERYIREVTLPAIEAGLARSGRPRSRFEVTGIPFIATGHDAETQEKACVEARRQIAFYASTPAYRSVLELHGWDALHDALHMLSKQGRWDEMGALIDDAVLATFAIVGTPKEAAGELRRRFDGLFDRVSLGLGNDVTTASQLFAALRQ